MKLWACVALVLSFSVAHAQRSIVFEERFDNNKNSWVIGSDDEANVSSEISGGVYKVTMNGVERWQYYSIPVAIDASKNFRITARFRQDPGADNSPYGLVYNTTNSDNNYQFIVNGNSEACVRRYKEGEVENISDWIKKDAFAKKGEWNQFEIRRENDALSFFLNNEFVYTYPFSYYRVFGDYLGILVWDKQVTAMDDLVVEQWEMDAIDLIQGAQANAKPVNLGQAINTAGADVVDCIAPDGSMLFFNRAYDKGNIGSDEYCDMYVSERLPSGDWSKGVNLGAPINNANRNYGIAVTQDLNTLFIQGTYTSDGKSNTDGLSYSKRTVNGWSQPVSMPIDDFYKNNTAYNNSHISPDGTVLVYSMERNDTRGGVDLYVCFKKPNGGWTAPKNMGDSLNTIGTDTGPFIAADGRTMYFSSTGHRGYEGLDVFVTVRKDDSWTNWSRPKNLGRPINTDEHDVFFQVTARGDSGYYSSTKNSMGRDDIFSIALPEGAKPIPTFLVRGRVLNAVTKQPVEANVVYEDLNGKEKSGTATSSPTDGKYRAILVRGTLYGVHADAEGYFPLSEKFDARDLKQYTEAEKDLYLTPLDVNTTLRLNNLFFDFAKYDLRPESFPELDRLVALLKAAPTMVIQLNGHTDNVGADNDNMNLSQNRVNSVKAYLVSKGVNTSRLTAKGFGETKPIATNDTDDGRQLNRRVEFTILKK